MASVLPALFSLNVFMCGLLGFFCVLLSIRTAMPVAPSPVRSSDLLLVYPEICLGFCHIKLEDMQYFEVFLANTGFVYLQLLDFY